MAFDLNPNQIGAAQNGTHFEQIYQRAVVALQNAVSAFDDAKDVTRMMRSEQDSLEALQASILSQERAYTNALIEVYGTPYPDDIGPGKTYKQGYAGPDFINYSIVDPSEFDFPDVWNYSSATRWSFPLMNLADNYEFSDDIRITFVSIDPTNRATWGLGMVVVTNKLKETVAGEEVFVNKPRLYFSFDLGPHGFQAKPDDWKGVRLSPGKVQIAINNQIDAHGALAELINSLKNDHASLFKYINNFKVNERDYDLKRQVEQGLWISEQIVSKAEFANDIAQVVQENIKEDIILTADGVAEALPSTFIAGVASGGDLTSAGRAALKAAGGTTKAVSDKVAIFRNTLTKTLRMIQDSIEDKVKFETVDVVDRNAEVHIWSHEFNCSPWQQRPGEAY